MKSAWKIYVRIGLTIREFYMIWPESTDAITQEMMSDFSAKVKEYVNYATIVKLERIGDAL